MARYDVLLSRTVVEYRMVTVNESSPDRARKRALAMVRGEIEPDSDMGSGIGLAEDPGEWCDSTVARPFVRSVEERKP